MSKKLQQGSETERLLRPISIRQPLVELILRGEKTIEWRSQPTRVRERVYLYASLTLNTVDGFAAKDALLLPRGAILGSVAITDCIQDPDGSFGFVLEAPLRYAQPLKFSGQPQPLFWKPKV